MNEEQKRDREQLAQNNENLPLAAEFDPDATVLAPWSKRRRELEMASMSTEVKPLMSESMGEAIVPTEVRPFISEPMGEATVPTEVKPLISEPIGQATVPTEVRPFISEPIVPSQPRTRRGIARRALLIGGVTAAGIVSNGALAMALLGQTFKKSPPALPAVRPVHFTPGQPILSLKGHTAAISNVAWSPDGRYLASAGGMFSFGASRDPFVRLWDITAFLRRSTASLQTIEQPTHKWRVSPYGLSTDKLHWTPDGKYLLTNITNDDVDNAPAMFDPFNSNSKPRLFTNKNIKKPAFKYAMMGPQGSTLAAIDRTLRRYHKIDLWQLQAPTEPYASLIYTDAYQFVGDSSSYLNAIGWSSDNIQLAGFTGYNEVVIWDTQKRTVNAVVKLPDRTEASSEVLRITLSWSPGNPDLLAVSNFDTIAIVNARQKKVLYQLSTDDKGALDATRDPENPSTTYPHVLGITWSPDGRYVAASYARSPKVFVWDLQAKNARTERGLTLQSALFPQDGSTGPTDTIYDLAWSPDGRYLATGSADQSITVWRVGS
jgi:WD40 repeat protein